MLKWPPLIIKLPAPIGPVGTFPRSIFECRAIAGDPLDPGWRCCGHPVHPGRSYCPAHLAMYFVPADPQAARRVLISRGALGRALR